MTMVSYTCVEFVELGSLSTTQFVLLNNLTSSLVLIGETDVNTGYFYLEINSSLANIVSVTGRTGAAMPAYSVFWTSMDDSLCDLYQTQNSYPFNQVSGSSFSGLCGRTPTSLAVHTLFSPGLFFLLVQVSGSAPFSLQAVLNATQCPKNKTNQCQSPATQIDIASSKALGSYTIPAFTKRYWYVDVPAGALTSLSFNVDSPSGDGWIDSYIDSPYISRVVGSHYVGTMVPLSNFASSSFNWQAEDFYVSGRFYFAIWTEDGQSTTVSVSVNMQVSYASTSSSSAHAPTTAATFVTSSSTTAVTSVTSGSTTAPIMTTISTTAATSTNFPSTAPPYATATTSTTATTFTTAIVAPTSSAVSTSSSVFQLTTTTTTMTTTAAVSPTTSTVSTPTPATTSASQLMSNTNSCVSSWLWVLFLSAVLLLTFVLV